MAVMNPLTVLPEHERVAFLRELLAACARWQGGENNDYAQETANKSINSLEEIFKGTGGKTA